MSPTVEGPVRSLGLYLEAAFQIGLEEAFQEGLRLWRQRNPKTPHPLDGKTVFDNDYAPQAILDIIDEVMRDVV